LTALRIDAAIVWHMDLSAGTASATPFLVGSTIQITYLYPDTSTVYAGNQFNVVVVDPGQEFPNFAGFVDIDIQDTKILIKATRNGGPNFVAFDGLKFFDINGLIPAWTPTLNAGGTTFAGFGASALTFTGDTIFANFAGLTISQGQTVEIDLAPASSPSTVPEPASLLLLGTGVLRLAARRRRRN